MTNSNILATGKTAVKEHRGTLRIWVEGSKPAKAGFIQGRQFAYTLAQGALIVTLSAIPCRTVSSRNTIDITTKELEEYFVAGDKLTITYSENLITFRRI